MIIIYNSNRMYTYNFIVKTINKIKKLIKAIRNKNREGDFLLGLYIHIPFCVQKCKYCDFNSYKMIVNEMCIRDSSKRL